MQYIFMKVHYPPHSTRIQHFKEADHKWWNFPLFTVRDTVTLADVRVFLHSHSVQKFQPGCIAWKGQRATRGFSH
jgi:hypothetical protein